ncbi:uncharacterized protein [Oscarella lobularis]|uniref:uncharacterized protein isoform X2 n=1 Tax=Oscarella lobularis TaxID=121494 RepID=UPI0033135BFE
MAAPAVLPRRYLWEWKDPNDVSRLWKPFSIELNEELEAGSSAGELKFEIAGSPYIAHFSRSPMIQINEATKYKREIRRREGNFDHSRICTQWQWVDDTRFWIDYDSNISAMLTEALSSAVSLVSFRLDQTGAEYNVNLKENRQINKASNFRREIRCIPVYRRGYSWEYQDDEGIFVPYVSDAQDDLEEAYQKKEASVTLKIFKRKYDIDLNKMVQTRRAFNTKRKIQRVIILDGIHEPGKIPSPVPASPFSPNSPRQGFPPYQGDSAVTELLTRLSLNEYVPTFAREKIAMSDTHLLTDVDLEKMCIPLGHRKRLLSAFSEAKMEDTIPNEFYCPITMEVMTDPVLAADGFSYERLAIEHWLQTRHAAEKTHRRSHGVM